MRARVRASIVCESAWVHTKTRTRLNGRIGKEQDRTGAAVALPRASFDREAHRRRRQLAHFYLSISLEPLGPQNEGCNATVDSQRYKGVAELAAIAAASRT